MQRLIPEAGLEERPWSQGLRVTVVPTPLRAFRSSFKRTPALGLQSLFHTGLWRPLGKASLGMGKGCWGPRPGAPEGGGRLFFGFSL